MRGDLRSINLSSIGRVVSIRAHFRDELSLRQVSMSEVCRNILREIPQMPNGCATSVALSRRLRYDSAAIISALTRLHDEGRVTREHENHLGEQRKGTMKPGKKRLFVYRVTK